jgi:hypothetical protein
VVKEAAVNNLDSQVYKAAHNSTECIDREEEEDCSFCQSVRTVLTEAVENARAQAIQEAAETCRQRARTYKACGYKFDPTKGTEGPEAIANECAFFVERILGPHTPTEFMGIQGD